MSGTNGQLAGRKCSVCSHPERAEIDRAIVVGELPRAISKRFSESVRIDEQAVRRHANSHLPRGAMASAVEAQTEGEKARATDLVLTARQLLSKSVSILQRAEQSGDLRAALMGIREASRCTELMGKLMGDIQETHVTNVLVSPVFVSVQQTILQALEPYPDARNAVVQALERMN